jgi:hypothetical protein
MGFKVTDWVDPLDFDFKPLFDYSGTITEPSDADISRFLRKWYKLIESMRTVTTAALVAARAEATAEEAQATDPDPNEPVLTTEQAIEAMVSIDWKAVEDEVDQSPQTEAARHTLTEMCRLVEDLAHGSIRADKLAQVPMRARGVFFGWLVGELTEQGKGSVGSSSS